MVLRHELPPENPRESHFDLMLDTGPHLRTWAVPRWPLSPERAEEADELPPHRLAYLTYEGPVRGNRGHVRRLVAGHYQMIAERDLQLLLRLDHDGGSDHLLLTRDVPDSYRWWLTRLTAEAVRKI